MSKEENPKRRNTGKPDRAGSSRKPSTRKRTDEDRDKSDQRRPERKKFEKKPGQRKFDREESDRRPASRRDDKRPPRTGKREDNEERSRTPRSKNPATSRENYDKKHGRVKYERDETTPSFRSKYSPAPRKPYRGKRGSEDFPSESKRDNTTRLNKYLANAGLCSRRDADELIKSGMVEVNGKVITEMGFKVSPGDQVKYAGERVSPEKPVYVLLNKPKDTITTTKDPQGRNTVMRLIRGVGNYRVFPVGRLDRDTTGLLLLTNDGDLAKKLTHPKHGVKKLYHVQLDKAVKPEHMHQLVEGVELEDGVMAADVVSYVAESNDKKQVGVEIHSGKNRIVRRLFEHLGYKIQKLDRVVFAGLTKRDLPRGKWRHLTEQEINYLKMLK